MKTENLKTQAQLSALHFVAYLVLCCYIFLTPTESYTNAH